MTEDNFLFVEDPFDNYDPIHEDIDDELINMAMDLRKNVDEKMDNLRISDSLELIFDLFTAIITSSGKIIH